MSSVILGKYGSGHLPFTYTVIERTIDPLLNVLKANNLEMDCTGVMI